MRLPRLLAAALGAAVGVAGAIASTVVARVDDADRIPVDQLSIALVVATYAGVALLVSVARPGNRVGTSMVLGAAAWGVGEGLLALGLRPGGGAADAWLVTLGTASRALGWLVLVLAVPFLFPDGRAPWPGRRAPGVLVAAAITVFTAATLLAPTPLERRAQLVDSPTGLPRSLRPLADAIALGGLGLCLAALLVAVAGLAHRWRSGDTLRQQQLLWLALAFALPALFIPVIATELARPWMFALVTLPVPVAVAVAILQRRLYDVQLAVSRTLTYLALSGVVAALYALTVAGAGAVLDERGATWLPWLAAGVVAVSFAPLRNTLQRAVTRLTYGQWAQPADVLGSTARRLSDAMDVPALLQTLAGELGETLLLSRVEITDTAGRRLATHGPAGVDHLDTMTLTAYGAPVGTLRWQSARPLREADRRLLDGLAGQLGAVVHAAALVDTLRDARHRLVLTREEERRRLRRELHDGLGSALASLTLKVDELRNRRPSLADSDAELLALRSSIQGVIGDLRRVVEGLRPAPLDDLGLTGALEQLALRGSPDAEVQVVVGPLPALPAAVEVAVFRVIQEALANARRHSGARHVAVELHADRGTLHAEVRDDGTGVVSPRPDGVGLASMRERAEELGGRLTVCGQPERGTHVRLEVPLGAAVEVVS